jgi:hypothetical protein
VQVTIRPFFMMVWVVHAAQVVVATAASQIAINVFFMKFSCE